MAKKQGEPSDAQLRAAAEAFSLAPFSNDEDGVLAPLRAALRAAAVNVGSGEPCQQIAEEPEWEYGIKCPPMDVAWLGTRESVDATLAKWADAGAPLTAEQGVFRRIKQGTWVPVKQDGVQ